MHQIIVYCSTVVFPWSLHDLKWEFLNHPRLGSRAGIDLFLHALYFTSRTGFLLANILGHTANEGSERIQYKCLVPIYVLPEMKLRRCFQNRNIMFCLPISTVMSLWAIYIFTISVCLFCCSQIGRLILGTVYNFFFLLFFFFIYNNCVCTGRVPDPTSLFLPTSFCM